MIRKIVVIAFWGAVLAISQSASGRGLEVRPAENELIEAKTNTVVTTVFRITNQTTARHELVTKLELPQGWKAMTNDLPFHLSSDKTLKKIVSFFVPKNTEPGRYKIRYIVQGRKKLSLSDYYEFELMVTQGQYQKTQELKKYVLAGQSTDVSFQITNNSRHQSDIAVTVDSEKGTPLVFNPKHFKLGPKQSKIVTVTLRPDGEITKNFTDNIHVTALFHRGGKVKTKTVSKHPIQVVVNEKLLKEKALARAKAKAQARQIARARANIWNREKQKQQDKQKQQAITQAVKRNFKFLEPGDTEKRILQAGPRGVVTVAFGIKNPTKHKLTFVPKLKMPKGWSQIAGSKTIELAPNENKTNLIGFSVPKKTPAGEYSLDYTITEQQYPDLRESTSFKVIVKPVIKVAVDLIESPKYVIAGEKYQSFFVVRNQGNTEYDIQIKVNGSEETNYVIDNEKFKLLPGQAKAVVVTAATDQQSKRKVRHAIHFVAAVTEQNVEIAQSAATSVVEVIPLASGEEKPYHTIKTQAIISYVSEKGSKDSSGAQITIKGQGTLDEEGKKNVKFHFTGPDIVDKSIFGQRDEYLFSYWTDKYQLHLGDRAFRLSNLTEGYLYGRGLETSLNLNDDLTLGMYHVETRWLEPGIEETAAFLDYNINEKAKIGLNYLRKNDNFASNDIVSIETEIAPAKNTKLELEYALGSGADRKDNGYIVRLYGRDSIVNYFLKLIHAGPDYPGYYKDLDYLTSGFALKINKNLKLNASLRFEKNNLDMNQTLSSAAFERYSTVGLGYSFNNKNNTTLHFDWLNRDRQDQLIDPLFDYQQDSLRVALAHNLGKFALQGSADIGKTKDRITNQNSKTERYTATLNFRPNNKQYYRAYAYYDEDVDSTGTGTRGITLGFKTRQQIAERTFFSMLLETNDFEAETASDRDNLQMGLDHIFKNKNKLSIKLRHTRYRGTTSRDATSLLMQYTIPMGLPISKRKSIGSVYGFIYDNKSQKAIDGAIVNLNDLITATDTSGRFSFNAVRPGIYYLNVNNDSLGENRLTKQKTPIQITVAGGKATQVDLQAVVKTSLTGQVMVYRYDTQKLKSDDLSAENNTYYSSGTGITKGQKGKLVEDYGLQNTIIELKKNDETKRVMTDRHGRFEILDLRPGIWTLKLYTETLPQYYYLEKNNLKLDLKSGQPAQVNLKVLPRKRQIKIIGKQKSLDEEIKK
ncbi:MAG: hypothetical protein FVQ80_06185 [Planctomycetes bacterium]|nr:hypothetical protein [Planctomycetota bacterium]